MIKLGPSLILAFFIVQFNSCTYEEEQYSHPISINGTVRYDGSSRAVPNETIGVGTVVDRQNLKILSADEQGKFLIEFNRFYPYLFFRTGKFDRSTLVRTESKGISSYSDLINPAEVVNMDLFILAEAGVRMELEDTSLLDYSLGIIESSLTGITFNPFNVEQERLLKVVGEKPVTLNLKLYDKSRTVIKEDHFPIEIRADSIERIKIQF